MEKGRWIRWIYSYSLSQSLIINWKDKVLVHLIHQLVIIMTKKATNNVPTWYKDKTNKYHTILTDDIDSLLSCAILKQIMGWSVEEIFLLKKKVKGHEGQDLKGKTKNATQSEGIASIWHCTKANVSIIISQDFQILITKTKNLLIQILWRISHDKIIQRNMQGQQYYYFGHCTVYKKKVWQMKQWWCCSQSTAAFLGYYSSRYRQYIKHYLVDVLDLPEFYHCIERHEKEEFYAIQDKYRLREKITLKKGHVITKIDIDAINDILLWDTDTNLHIELPQDKFYPDKYFIDVVKDIYGKRAEEIWWDNPTRAILLCAY